MHVSIKIRGGPQFLQFDSFAHSLNRFLLSRRYMSEKVLASERLTEREIWESVSLQNWYRFNLLTSVCVGLYQSGISRTGYADCEQTLEILLSPTPLCWDYMHPSTHPDFFLWVLGMEIKLLWTCERAHSVGKSTCCQAWWPEFES